MVVSVDPEIDSDIPAMIGASAALVLSGVPFAGPIGAARVGYVNGQYLLNPTKTELETSQLDLVVAGTRSSRADGGIGSAAIARKRDVGRGGVRPRAIAGSHRCHQRIGR